MRGRPVPDDDRPAVAPDTPGDDEPPPPDDERPAAPEDELVPDLPGAVPDDERLVRDDRGEG